ncbi:hypothetical protein Tco_0773320 [Tanacetum coccineum]|uniref:Secreted protein n=1 Tax=Tanacetum coccineum TaxID=301880 RepID=A0ABQ4ZKF5_9ASTR
MVTGCPIVYLSFICRPASVCGFAGFLFWFVCIGNLLSESATVCCLSESAVYLFRSHSSPYLCDSVLCTCLNLLLLSACSTLHLFGLPQNEISSALWDPSKLPGCFPF